MSESELFFRTFVPAPGYDVGIRVGFVPIYSVGIKGDMFLFVVSDSGLFFRRNVLICCLNQGCFSGEMSLFVVLIRVVFVDTSPYL